MNIRCDFFLQTVTDSQYVTDCLYENGLALYLRVSRSDEGVLTESPLQTIQKNVVDTCPQSATVFAQIVGEVLGSYEFKTDFAFSASFVANDNVYLVSKGEGGVFLVKDGVVTRIIALSQNATGHLASGDVLVLGPQNLVVDQEVTQRLSLPMDKIEDDLGALYKDSDIGGFVIIERLSEQTPINDSGPLLQPTTTVDSSQKLESPDIPSSKVLLVKKNLVVTVLSLVIVVVLVWSVVFGYRRRVEADILQKAQEVSVQVDEKLLDASETALFDVSEAKAMLSDARSMFEPLMQKAKENNLENQEQITKIESSITTVSKKIGELENKKPDEFYDIALLGDGVTIDRFAQSEDGWVGLVDFRSGKTYAMTIEKKSVTTFTSIHLRNAKQVVFDKQKIYYLTNDGVYLKEQEGKEKKVIKTEGWGNVVDMATYNGNIYLLDKKNNDIYKYLVASDDLFSAKTSYFKSGQAVDMSKSAGFAVDGSFYVGFSDNKIEKYTSGISQPFTIKTKKQFTVTKIMTNALTDKIFVFDKQNGKILIFGKDGEYKREILSAHLKQAKDIALISNDRLIFLLGKKIYQLK